MTAFSSQDSQYMQRALELASLGHAEVAPNPMVGCVIVKNGSIIGEGWHQQYGQAHAEKNAIDQVSNAEQLVGSTVYVNLEPCAHFGKTPPCCDLLIHHQVARVVIGNYDPNPLVNGAGVERMRQAGLQVDTGLLEAAGRELNQVFFQQFEQGAFSQTASSSAS